MTGRNVSTREFKARLSHYLAQAGKGRAVQITRHRKVIARVTGVAAADMRGVAGVLAAGAGAWDGRKPRGASVRLSSGGHSVSEMILQDRG